MLEPGNRWVEYPAGAGEYRWMQRRASSATSPAEGDGYLTRPVSSCNLETLLVAIAWLL